jgi:hypothetical protein
MVTASAEACQSSCLTGEWFSNGTTMYAAGCCVSTVSSAARAGDAVANSAKAALTYLTKMPTRITL